MEFKLVRLDGTVELFSADDPRHAVREAFSVLKITGRINLRKFCQAGAKAIYLGDKKVFPLP